MAENELPNSMTLMQECEDALNRCRALELSLIGIKSRVDLGLPAKPMINDTKWALIGLNERMDKLMRISELQVEVPIGGAQELKDG